MQVKIAKDWKPSRASAALCTCYRKYFPPSPTERPLDVIDCTELAIKKAMPGFRVRVEVTRIATGNGNPSAGLGTGGGQH